MQIVYESSIKMAVTTFKNNLKQLQFSFLAEKEEAGVVLTADFEKSDRHSISPDILFALEIAKNKFDADAVYFRYFCDGRGFVPQIYLYDNTENLLKDKQKNIHIKVWSGCQVPMYIIVGKSDVAIFDAREKAQENKETKAYDTIKLAGDVIRTFSAQNFDNGLFWEEQEHKKHFQFEKSAYRDLIEGLRKVYLDFQEKSGLNSHVALKLLVQSLLIKYLEEREDESKNGYFAETYFQNNFGCANFCDVIRAGKLLDLLDQLAIDFNGRIFEWNKEQEIEDRKSICRIEVKQLAEYLDGKSKDSQYVLWRLYSFSHLPIELISSVYEALLTDSKDIVYTPEMIVTTLVDECMPLKSPKENFKLIDVSCGSGIFLVKAYKRIIQWWRYQEWQKTGELKKPSLAILKQLLLNSIYGIDIQVDAIRLSVFSLALALLDEVDLNPPVWQELKFPDLGEKNIIVNDFFKYITSNPANDFDLVLGNPPFNLSSVNKKEPDRKKYFCELEKQTGYKSEIQIPDENPALHFLVQTMKLLKDEAILCLIQPSGPLLYQKDTDFKQGVFSQFNLLQVIDFTKLADVLWGKKNVATAAIFMQKSEPDDRDVVHIVANRTFSNINRLFLEFDYYDFHMVSKEAVLKSPYVWKANLLGGGRITNLIDRLSKKTTLGEFLNTMFNQRWVKGEGFIENKKGISLDYISGQSFLPTEFFIEKGIDYSGIRNCEVEKFHRKTNYKIFLSPHLLIRKVLGKEELIVELVDQNIVFKSDILSIYAPPKDRIKLLKLGDFLKGNSALLRFYILATSSRVKILKATSLYDEDILNIPYPEDLKELILSKVETLLVEDSLKYFFSNNAEEELSRDISEDTVIDFSNIFCHTLNSVYQIENKAFRLYKILDAGKYYAVHFEYTDDDYKTTYETATDLDNYIQQIIPMEKIKGKSFHIQRIMKVYGKDCIIFVKPKQLRYWLPSIALRDADETFTDYINTRYY